MHAPKMTEGGSFRSGFIYVVWVPCETELKRQGLKQSGIKRNALKGN